MWYLIQYIRLLLYCNDSSFRRTFFSLFVLFLNHFNLEPIHFDQFNYFDRKLLDWTQKRHQWQWKKWRRSAFKTTAAIAIRKYLSEALSTITIIKSIHWWQKNTSFNLRNVQNRPTMLRIHFKKNAGTIQYTFCLYLSFSVFIYSHAGALELYRSIFILCVFLSLCIGCKRLCVVYKCNHCCGADFEPSLSFSQFYSVAVVV